ncbi:protein NEGATIVE REGULATOR OF RESISTANCE-like [Miscanthus floridulus]|uniref:protein NEGATIVE REGULATOR OF RESISTANCE-like n=1 Tax=Miscanthus floridulus TaxID=154761 RepID=UPI00345AA3FB
MPAPPRALLSSARCETMDATTATAKRKRKRPDTDITGDAAAVVDEASDAEVEEFYAILRRIRDASRRLCGAGARPAAPRTPAWRPSFSWEDFAAPPAPEAPAPSQPRPDEPVPAPAGTERATAPSPRAGLDLNAEPEPEAPSARVPA